MKHYNELPHLSSPAADALPPDQVRLAASAYLAQLHPRRLHGLRHL